MCTPSNSYANPEFVGRSLHRKQLCTNMNFTHQGPHFFCIKCGDGFLFKYQLKNHTNTHTDFVIKCHYPRCGKVYKSEGEYRRHKKVHQTAYQEYTCTTCGKNFTEKKIGMNICLFTRTNSRMNVENAVRNTGAV